MTDSVRDALRAEVVDDAFTLAAYPESETPFISSKDDAKDGLDDMEDALFDLHEMMFAAKERAVLLVLQGTDASGKNGTIKHVVRLVNPAGVKIASFGEPTEEEKQHHFLWRIKREVPGPGMLGVFDRSHYEDVLVPIAEQTLDDDTVAERFEEIRSFEADLVDRGVTVVKCLLHISYDEQRERFLRRLRRHDKRWKFRESDLDTRRLWDRYRLAYGRVVQETSTEDAPWYIVPSDHKWYRNWAVARLLIESWEDMDLSYPQPDLDLDALRAALEDPA